jgi:two-component system, OmpR family, sensor kinase
VSLRARLVTGLLVLATVGLVALALVTYLEQRSFLRQRVDQQLAAAQGVIDHSLDQQGAIVSGSQQEPPLRSAPRVNLPPGTFGQRRDPSGKVVGKNIVLSYGEKALPPPKLPARIPVGKAITVGAAGGSGLHYRVLAQSAGDQPGSNVVAIPLREVDETLHRLLAVEGLVIAGVLAALTALALWVVRLGLRPLDQMGDGAGAIAAGDLSRRVTPATDRTEVGRLGLALNAMLGQIENAFAERQASQDRLRRFVADASHELRTPLASIRGYAELFRIGAARSEADTDKAMGRIEDEATRMGVIVEDLLTLARLDQLPQTARTPVNLAELVAEGAADARAAGPDRRIDTTADPDVMVLGDASELRQVIANLIGNALVHTPPGTPVELRLAAKNGEATLEVRDHGAGVPTDDPNALFERFWRAEPGRARGPGGAGLGLSIVAAIVEAHEGQVAAGNAPGGGASFTVTLPLSVGAVATSPTASGPS